MWRKLFGNFILRMVRSLLSKKTKTPQPTPIPSEEQPSPTSPTLPTPEISRRLFFSAYFEDGPRFTNRTAELRDIFKMPRAQFPYYAWSYRGYAVDSEEIWDQWLPAMVAGIQYAVSQGRPVIVNLGQERWERCPMRQIINALVPFWDSIVMLEWGDEPNLPGAAIEFGIAETKALIASLGLSPRPVGVHYAAVSIANDPQKIQLAGLDYVSIAAYTVGDPSGDSEIDASRMWDYLMRALAAVPSTMPFMIVLQTYTRSGGWKDHDLTPIVTRAFNVRDPRLLGFLCFNFARPDGFGSGLEPERAPYLQPVLSRLAAQIREMNDA